MFEMSNLYSPPIRCRFVYEKEQKPIGFCSFGEIISCELPEVVELNV